MSVQMMYRLTCDEANCPAAQAESSETRTEARELGRAAGWQIGPFHVETNRGRFTHNMDFCPKHHRPDWDE